MCCHHSASGGDTLQLEGKWLRLWLQVRPPDPGAHIVVMHRWHQSGLQLNLIENRAHTAGLVHRWRMGWLRQQHLELTRPRIQRALQ